MITINLARRVKETIQEDKKIQILLPTLGITNPHPDDINKLKELQNKFYDLIHLYGNPVCYNGIDSLYRDLIENDIAEIEPWVFKAEDKDKERFLYLYRKYIKPLLLYVSTQLWVSGVTYNV